MSGAGFHVAREVRTGRSVARIILIRGSLAATAAAALVSTASLRADRREWFDAAEVLLSYYHLRSQTNGMS